MEQINAVEHLAKNTNEQVTSPEQKAREKYNKAVEKADKIISSVTEDPNGGKQLTGITAANAQYMLDGMSWDRSFLDTDTQEYPFKAVPDSVIEAQRLIYAAYKPSDKIQGFQQEGFKKAFESLQESELETIIESWGTMDTEKKKELFKTFGAQLSTAFNFEKPVPLIFMENSMAGAEATHVEGQGIAIPDSFFAKNSNLFDALEILAHENNHAVQEKLVNTKEGDRNLTDVEWFRLSKERSTFLPDSEFKSRGKNTDSLDSTYHSLPVEQDSFNAQRIFRTTFEERTAPILDRKLESLGLPPRIQVKAMLKVFDVLDEFIDIGIPITEASLSKRLSESEKQYLTQEMSSQSYEEVHKKIRVTRAKVQEHFRGIF